MTFQGDPYRVLGIAPGASLNEIRSAYRRLVKQWHPDAAGDRATPRFLAIQAAYERLVDGEGRLRRQPPGVRPPAGRPGEPRADPNRARASRDAWRARRSAWTGSTGPGRPGQAAGDAGTTGRPGAAGAPPGWGTASGGGSGAGAGSGTGAGTGSGPGARAGRGHRERRSHHRTTRKATIGSTTYDEAAEPLDPAWGGATWYGASSGTYWTINPREYADPRKHGPEYQARARRERTGTATTDPAAAPADPLAQAETEASGAAGWRWSAPGGTATQGDPHDWDARRWSFAAGGDRAAPGDRARRTDQRPDRHPAPPPAPAALPDLEALLRKASPASFRRRGLGPDRRWRLALALTAWPPIGYATAILVDALTGCGAFAAGCSQAATLAPILVQPLILLLLAALPSFAASAAFASLVALAVALPAATVISVISRWQPDAARALLALVVATAYLAALAGPAIARRRAGAASPPRG
jgi:hypothetical protein